MSPVRESVLPHDHDVTIYDADTDLIDELTEFVTDGLALGDSVLLVATAEHRAALALSLAEAGCSMTDAVARGQLHLEDAAEILATILRDSHPDVDRLGRVQPFSMLCAYSTSSLSEPGDLAALRAVCDAHSEVLPPPSYEAGMAGEILTGGYDETRIFVATPPAIRAVRHLVVDTLRAWGEYRLVPDAALLVSELATNAVRHACSPFRVSVTRSDAVIRIAVEDLGSAEPQLRPVDLERLGGRGVALVDAMSQAWGVDAAPGGKIVWCELPASGRLAG